MTQLMNESVKVVFVEQPLALPGSVNSSMTKVFIEQPWLHRVFNNNGACTTTLAQKGFKRSFRKTPNSCQRDIYLIKLSRISGNSSSTFKEKLNLCHQI